MRAIISLAVKDLLKRWALAFILAGLFGCTFAAFFALTTYQNSAVSTYAQLETTWLVVGNSNGLSEIHGSRLKPAIKELLWQNGYSDPIPEIHQVVGTSISNGTLMRGFLLEEYRNVSGFFTMLSGRTLEPGDASRLVMVGETLARTKDVHVGSDLLLRGRKFRVIGIFRTGSIQDNEAWISLSDAQKLLNYGEDVSIYLIPDGGVLKTGDLLTDGVSVSQKGEVSGVVGSSILSFFNFLGIVAELVGIATAITLVNLLWRLAFLRRHEFGILKSLGFGFKALFVYFLTQSGLIIFSGVIMGLSLGTFLLFARLQEFSAWGFGLNTSLDLVSLISMVSLTLGMLALGSTIPLVIIHKTPIPDLLGRD
jgi:ABC-type lipoprotein release transport system permease subunit